MYEWMELCVEMEKMLEDEGKKYDEKMRGWNKYLGNKYWKSEIREKGRN